MSSGRPYSGYVTDSTAPVETGYSEEQQTQLASFYQYQTARRDMVSDFDRQRRQIQTDYATWVTQSERDLTKSLRSLYADYTKNRSRSAEDLESSIAEATDSAYKQNEESARNHYESLRSLQISHSQRMVDLLESRDVEGLTKEMRSYETQVDQQNRDYGQQQAKATSDLADRIAKMEDDARKKELQEEEDYNLKVVEMRAALAEELAAKEAERAAATLEVNQKQNEELQKMDDAFYVEVNGLQTLLQDKYDQLLIDFGIFKETYTGEWVTMAQQIAAVMATLLPDSVEASSRTGNLVMPAVEWADPHTAGYGSRAAGGYVNSGMYRLHNNEFVLSPETTQSLEGRYGHLSQQTFNDRMGQQTFVFSPTFSGMGAQDKSWFLKAANDVFNQNMAQLKGRVRA